MICEAVTPCNQADRYAEAEISNMRRMDPGLKPASTTDAAAKPSPYDGGTLQQWAPTACSKYTADLHQSHCRNETQRLLSRYHTSSKAMERRVEHKRVETTNQTHESITFRQLTMQKCNQQAPHLLGCPSQKRPIDIATTN